MDLFKLIGLSISFFLLAQSSNAQKIVKIKVENSVVMTSDFDEVWTAISNLENLDRLVPEIISETSAVGNGQGSIVTLALKANGAKVVEEITKLDNKKRIISYEMLETPMPLSYYKATIHMLANTDGNYTIEFIAVLKTDEVNSEKMKGTIDNFQKTLLTNVKNKYYEK